MINSLLMLGSTNGKFKTFNYFLGGLWIAYMLFNANWETGLIFTLANIVAFSIVFAIGKLVKSKYSNMLISILSILLWSVIIDVICYYMYPQFAMGQSIIGYVFNGILFNYKYVLTNIIFMSAVHLFENITGRIKKYIDKNVNIKKPQYN